jgi:signal transduction histidine kinase
MTPAAVPDPAAGTLAEDEARAVLALLPLGVAVLGADHRYRWANPAHLALTGLDLAALQALPYQDITGCDDVDQELDALGRLHAGASQQVQWRRRFGPPDGRRWCEVTAHARRAADGSLATMIWMVQPDASGSPDGAADLALRELHGDLARIAALLSHDALQPTRMISSFAGLLEQRLRGGPAEGEIRHLQSMQQASDDLRDLLREATLFLRVRDRVSSPAPVSLRRCAEAAAARLAALVPGLALSCPGDLEVMLEAEDLTICLQAALALAWARSASGALEIGGTALPAGSEVVVSAPGAAMQQGDGDRAFMLGARIALSGRPGTMLPGLAVAQRIAQRSGGGIVVEDRAGALRVVLRFGG